MKISDNCKAVSKSHATRQKINKIQLGQNNDKNNKNRAKLGFPHKL